MSDPLSGTPFGQIDDPFVGQLDPFLEVLEPFRNPAVTNLAPYSDLELYQRHMDGLTIPESISEHEDALCRQISELELDIENPSLTESAAFPLSRSPDHLNPMPQRECAIKRPVEAGQQEKPLQPENTWMGFREPIPPGFGRLRPSRAGARNPSDVFCKLIGERIESSECNNTCEYYDQEIQVCRYGDSQRSFDEEFSR